MSNIDPIGSFHPVIDYVDVIKNRNNPDYAPKKQYSAGNKDSLEVIKWCRRNFGDRGDGWDFAGSGKSLTIFIWSNKLQFMYEMWQS